MRADRIGYFLVGLFVITMFSGLIGLLTVLGGRGERAETYTTVFTNVSGLKFGTPVFFEGFQAGQIEAIEPITVSHHTEFLIRFSVLASLAIPDDSEVIIVQPNLLSGRALSIAIGRSATLIAPGARIAAGELSGLAALPNLVGGGQELIEDARALLLEATLTMAEINRWVGEDMTRIANQYEALPVALLAETELLMDELQDTVATANAVIGRANLFLGDDNADSVARSLANFESLSADLVQTSADLRSLARDAGVMVSQIANLVADNKTDIEGGIVDMRYTMETIAERIDSVTYNLEGTSRNLYEFSRQIRINPGLLLGGTEPAEATVTGTGR